MFSIQYLKNGRRKLNTLLGKLKRAGNIPIGTLFRKWATGNDDSDTEKVRKVVGKLSFAVNWNSR